MENNDVITLNAPSGEAIVLDAPAGEVIVVDNIEIMDITADTQVTKDANVTNVPESEAQKQTEFLANFSKSISKKPASQGIEPDPPKVVVKKKGTQVEWDVDFYQRACRVLVDELICPICSKPGTIHCAGTVGRNAFKVKCNGKCFPNGTTATIFDSYFEDEFDFLLTVDFDFFDLYKHKRAPRSRSRSRAPVQAMSKASNGDVMSVTFVEPEQPYAPSTEVKEFLPVPGFVFLEKPKKLTAMLADVMKSPSDTTDGILKNLAKLDEFTLEYIMDAFGKVKSELIPPIIKKTEAMKIDTPETKVDNQKFFTKTSKKKKAGGFAAVAADGMDLDATSATTTVAEDGTVSTLLTSGKKSVLEFQREGAPTRRQPPPRKPVSDDFFERFISGQRPTVVKRLDYVYLSGARSCPISELRDLLETRFGINNTWVRDITFYMEGNTPMTQMVVYAERANQIRGLLNNIFSKHPRVRVLNEDYDVMALTDGGDSIDFNKFAGMVRRCNAQLARYNNETLLIHRVINTQREAALAILEAISGRQAMTTETVELKKF